MSIVYWFYSILECLAVRMAPVILHRLGLLVYIQDRRRNTWEDEKILVIMKCNNPLHTSFHNFRTLQSSNLKLLSPSFGRKNNYSDTVNVLLNAGALTLPLAVRVISPSYLPWGSSLCSRGYRECVLWNRKTYLLLICLNPVNQMDSGRDVNVSLNRKKKWHNPVLFHTDICDCSCLCVVRIRSICCVCRFCETHNTDVDTRFIFVPEVCVGMKPIFCHNIETDSYRSCFHFKMLQVISGKPCLTFTIFVIIKKQDINVGKEPVLGTAHADNTHTNTRTHIN